jgi:hypothetical protein
MKYLTSDDIVKVWLTTRAIHVRTKDGREAFEKFCDYPFLAKAPPSVRKNYAVKPFGVHWPDLDDEGLSFDGFFAKEQHTSRQALVGDYLEKMVA